MDYQQSNKQYEYIAFISYKREDEKWAKWLQRKLEYYKLPSSVRRGNPELPERIRPVFKDTTDLEPGVLAQKIQDALNSSKFLIVICSPRSANSVWVSKEVQSFIDSGRADHIIPFIIGGSPNASNPAEECFPEGLRQLAGEQELLGANINEMGRDAAAIKVVARMFNLRFDTLWQRYEKEQKRRTLYLSIIAILIMILSLGVVSYISRKNHELANANEKIVAERDRANQERSRAERANKKLEAANDSINFQSHLLTVANDSLSVVNNILATTVRNLDIERNNVISKSRELQIEQLRLIAKQAKTLFDEGNVLRSYQLIRPFAVEILSGKYPYAPEIASLINKIKWNLNKDGFKTIEILTESYNDSVYISPDLRYNPYTERGKFYLRDIHGGRTIVLPGEDRIDDLDIQFGEYRLYYRGICNAYMWDITNSKKLNLPETNTLGQMGHEAFYGYTLPDVKYPQKTLINSSNEIPDCFDYGIKELILKKGSYVVSLDNNEILVGNQLFTKRVLPISYNLGKTIIPKNTNTAITAISDSIKYNNLVWYRIDEKGPLKLYKWAEEDDATDTKLLLVNKEKHSYSEFTPFISYSMGNGIGYLFTAFILSEDEVLCVSGQTNHEIYNAKSQTRNLFQSCQLDGWSMGHVGLYLANAFKLDDRTLCDVRTNGQITIYDIPSRLIIDEYDIPTGGWLKNGKMVQLVSIHDNRLSISYEDCIYEVLLDDKLQSLNDDINLIDRFWE